MDYAFDVWDAMQNGTLPELDDGSLEEIHEHATRSGDLYSRAALDALKAEKAKRAKEAR